MSTTSNRKKLIISALGAVATGAAASAMLFAGAGTAQASTTVSATTDAFGVTIQVRSVGPGKSSGPCRYTAIPDYATTPAGKLPPLPVYNVPFDLTAGGKHNLWFPGLQTGTKWDVTVDCDGMGTTDSPTTQLTY
jgi:hypothetical protein